MAELVIQIDKIKDNIRSLSQYFKAHNIEWSLITKVFSGDKEFLRHILTEDVLENVNSVGDSRLTSLRNLKEVNPHIRTIYIKPPAEMYAEDIVTYADISLNSSYSTIVALNNAAKSQNKIHQIIIMVELGELREGVNRDDIMEFYEKVFDMDHIEVIGLGTNLGCMYGVEPTYDKLLQLSLYKELIAAKFNKNLKLISGGSSITMPLIERGMLPKDINHFRVGEAAFFGTSPLDNSQFGDLNTDAFEFKANIIELEEKHLIPDGNISDANIGHTASIDNEAEGETSFKAILDFGLLDVNKEDLNSIDQELQFVGVTSDMMVMDVGNNKSQKGKKYSIGDKIKFEPNYMAVARLLNSKFIDKSFVQS